MDKGGDLPADENIKIKEAIALFEKDGPYTPEKVLELAERIVALGHYSSNLKAVLRLALIKVYCKFSIEGLDNLYELADDNKAIVDALDFRNLNELQVLPSELKEEYVPFYAFRLPRNTLAILAADTDLMQTAVQRTNLLRVLRQNALLDRKKSKE